eukprot:scaffold69750_cov35-Cyclotella_meneghiniana.AAC.3
MGPPTFGASTAIHQYHLGECQMRRLSLGGLPWPLHLGGPVQRARDFSHEFRKFSSSERDRMSKIFRRAKVLLVLNRLELVDLLQTSKSGVESDPALTMSRTESVPPLLPHWNAPPTSGHHPMTDGSLRNCRIVSSRLDSDATASDLNEIGITNSFIQIQWTNHRLHISDVIRHRGHPLEQTDHGQMDMIQGHSDLSVDLNVRPRLVDGNATH